MSKKFMIIRIGTVLLLIGLGLVVWFPTVTFSTEGEELLILGGDEGRTESF